MTTVLNKSQPCGDCPFRRDGVQLGSEMLEEKVLSNLHGGFVHECHRFNDGTRMCAGFLAFCKHTGLVGRNMSIGVALGVLDLSILPEKDDPNLITSLEELYRRHRRGV